MQNNPCPQTDSLWMLILAYSLILIMANLLDARLIQLGPVFTDAGTLIYPLTFLLTGMITEVYDYRFAKQAIIAGFLANLFYLGYSQLVVHLPSPAHAPQNAAFAIVFSWNLKIWVASVISYFSAETLNVVWLSRLTRRFSGQHFPLRLFCVIVASTLVDTVIFSALAFYGSLRGETFIVFMATMWGIKLLCDTALLPVAAWGAKMLLREKIA